MSALNFFRAVVDAKNKGLQVEIVESHKVDEIFVIVTTPENEDLSVDRVFQDVFSDTDIKGQTDFIEYAIRSLGHYTK